MKPAFETEQLVPFCRSRNTGLRIDRRALIFLLFEIVGQNDRFGQIAHGAAQTPGRPRSGQAILFGTEWMPQGFAPPG